MANPEDARSPSDRPPIVAAADAPKVEAFPGVWLQVVQCGEKLMMTRVTARKGALFPEHSHPHEQMGYVVSGSMELTIDGESHVMGPGDTYLVPGGKLHSARALEDFDVIDGFSPPREDYIEMFEEKP